MTARLEISPAANRDIDAAVEWYDGCRESLGTRFIAALQHRFEYILRNPLASQLVMKPSVRRTLLHGFPYVIFYRILDDIIRVLAVIHASRSPKYISSRLR